MFVSVNSPNLSLCVSTQVLAICKYLIISISGISTGLYLFVLVAWDSFIVTYGHAASKRISHGILVTIEHVKTGGMNYFNATNKSTANNFMVIKLYPLKSTYFLKIFQKQAHLQRPQTHQFQLLQISQLLYIFIVEVAKMVCRVVASHKIQL